MFSKQLHATDSLGNSVDIQIVSTWWQWQRVESCLPVVVSGLLNPTHLSHADKDPDSDCVRLWDMNTL